MKRIFLSIAGVALFASASSAQFAVTTNGGSGLAGTYTSLANAITALNAATITSPVVITCPTGAETAPAGGYSITAQGTAVNTITIQGNGAANSIITAGVGTSTTNDGIVKLIGADFVTLQGFTMQESAGNVTTTTQVEWGVALLYATTTNGAQNDTIQNNTITLNRTNPNTFGIYSNSTHTATAPTTSATATGAAGGNDNLKVYGNNISNVNIGIVHVGPTAAADQNPTADIGGVALATGNTITNFGTTTTGLSGYANVSGTINGIIVRNTKNFNISFNTVTSSNGGTVVGTLSGIQIQASSNTPTGTLSQAINNNSISLRPGATGIAINGINMPSGSVNATTTCNFNNNDFNTFGHTVAGGTGAITFILQGGNPLVQNFNNNTFTNMSVNTTGTIIFFSFAPSMISTASMSLSGNSIVTGFTRTGVGSTTVWSSNASSVAGSTQVNSNNNFSNITLTGASAFTGISNTDGGTPLKTINGNTFSNITTGAGTVVPMSVNFCAAGSTVNNNTITGITTGSSITALLLGSTTNAPFTVSGNVIDPITSGGTSVIGISTASPALVLTKNKIYDLSGTVAGSVVNGIAVTTSTTSSAVTVSNNLIGNLTAPAATGSNAVIGINITGSATTSAFNVYYNTVYLNNTTSGAGFGSSGISTLASATAATSALDFRDNVIVNTSIQNGSGLTVAYRRSGTALNNYVSTSNNNDFYAGTPGASNLIFNDGTNSDQTIAAYKTRVASRDSASFTESPPFLSTAGLSANFLHINTAAATQLESGGTPVSGITDDFDGQTRNASTPDVGADEFTGIAADFTAPSISYSTLGSGIVAGTRSFTGVTITDASGVNTTAGTKPRCYYKKSTDANTSAGWKFVEANGTSSPFDFTIDYSQIGGVATNDIIQYFVVAQDNATTPNVGINSGTFNATPSSVALTAAAFPIGGSINQYTIVGSISGTFTVGSGGNYASLTGVGGAITDLNSKVITGPVVFNLIENSTAPLALESYPITINANSGSTSTNTVTIKPAGGQTISISASSVSSMFKINGASWIIIDGSNNGTSSRDLTITNTNTASATAAVWVASNGTGLGSTNCTIKNCNISTGVSTTSANFGVAVSGTTIGTSGADNDNDTVQNNVITVATVGIYATGTASVSTGGLDTLAITSNSVDYNGTLASIGIEVGNALTSSVSQNTVSEQTSSSQAPTAISLETGFVSSSVTRNTVTKSLNTNSSGYGGRGITVGTGAASSALQISNNMISGVNGTNFSGFTNSSSMGICIGTIGNSSTLTTTAGGVNLYFNSVNMSGTYSSSSNCLTTALYVGSGASALDLRDNIFVNSLNNTGTGTTSKAYAIYSAVANTAFTTIDYNDYFVSGTQGVLGFLTSDRTNLAGIQTGFGQNTNSIASDPLFTSATDLHVQVGSPVINTGVTISGIAIDYDGQTRPNGVAVDIGADEFVPSPGTLQFSTAAYSVTEAGLTATITVTRTGGSSGAASVNYATSNGSAIGGASCGAGVDYVNNSGTLNWADLDAVSKTFTVTVCNDGVTEPSEIVNLTLSTAVGATLGTPNTATLTILNSDLFSGTYTVGAGGNYPSLTGSSGIIAAMINGQITGPVVINLIENASAPAAAESYPITIPALNGSSASNTVTIKPAAAGTTITAPASATSVFVLFGADNIIIDGSSNGTSSRDLSIINSNSTTSGTSVISIISLGAGAGATNNTIKNTIIQNGANFSTSTTLFNFGIFVGGNGVANGPDNDSVTIQNNLIQRCQYGIQAVGDPAGVLDGLVIQDNTIGGTATADYIGRFGMLVGSATGANVTRNTVRNILFSTDGDTVGIFLSSGFVSSSVTRNSVSNMETNSSVDYGATGIYVSTATASSNLLVANNFVYDIRGKSSTTSFLGDTVVGIRVAGTNTGGVKIYDNSVNLFGNYAGYSGATITAALMVNATTPTALDVRGNIFTNTFNNTTVTTDKNYAIYTTSANTMFTDINYNDYFVSGAQGVLGAINSSDVTTLAALQTATAKDANSKNVDPLFTLNTNLHLQATSTLLGMGVSLAGVTTDFDGDTRPAVPDIGADEILTPGTIQFSPATYGVTEGTPTVTVTVTRTGGFDGSVSVLYNRVDGTATSPADYTSPSGNFIWNDGDAANRTITATIVDDGLYENAEDFTFVLSSPTGGAILGTSTATVTISDNDTAPSISIDSVSVSEGVVGGNAVFTVTQSAVSGATTTFNYASGGVTATANVDYTTVGGVGSIPAGSTTTTISVPITDDGVYEYSETFTVTLSGAVNASIGTAVGTGTITDNDTAPTLTIDSVSVVEGANAVFTVTQSAITERTTTFQYDTTNGTAVEPGDYTAAVAATGTIPAGSATTTITIPTNDDNLYEGGNETFTVTLSNQVFGATRPIKGSSNVGTGTIQDNDSAPTVQFNSATYSVNENVAGGNATITVTKTGATQLSATVNYTTTTPATATAGASCTGTTDYVTTTGTLTFASGDTSMSFNVPICNDTTFEGNENFTVSLSGPTGSTLGSPSSATVTIIEDDALPLVQFDAANYDVNEATGTVTVTVTKTGSVTALPATVNYATSPGSATAGSDYTTTSGTLTFLANQTSQTFDVPILPDSVYEGDEQFTVTLSTPVGCSIGAQNPSTVTILEDDDQPIFSINGNVEHPEGDSGPTAFVFTVTKSGSTALSSSVVYTAQDGTTGTPATLADSDYQSATGTLTFAAGDTSMQFTVNVNGDTKYENNENFIAHLSNPIDATISNTQNNKLGLIDNDDAAPTISIDSVTVGEAGGPAVFTVTQSAVSALNTTFQYSTADGTAVAPGDYTALVNEIGSIPAGSTTTTISVAIINDTTFENSETFTVTLSNEVNATLGTATGTGTITDNDTAPSISIDSVSVNEAAGNAVFTVTQSAESGKNTTFTYSTANGTAVAPGDYTAASNVAGGITAGNTTTTISIPIINDDIREGSETFTVTLSNEVNATLGTATGTGTITGNDDAPTFSIDNVTQAEASSGTTNFVFTVTKSGQTELDSTVDYHTEDGTATDANNDYEPATNTLTFGPTVTTQQITIVVNGDTRPEADETFTVVLTNPTGRPLAPKVNDPPVATGTGTIVNDDTCPAAFIVNNNGDASDADPGDGVCSTAGSVCTFRAAIEEANALTSCGTIDINFSGVVSPISLGTALPSIDHNVNLNGPGANLLTVQRSTAGGTGDFRVLEINASKTVAIFGLTISNGNSPALGGAGILNQGSLLLTSSTVSNNVSQPGTNGGGILSTPGSSLTIKSSTISGNTSGGGGGGIWIDGTGLGATGTIINSTISGNTTPESAGGINVHTSATVTFWNTTITNNRSNTGGGGGPGAGITNFGTVRLYNSIVIANYQGIAGTAAGNFPYPAHSSSSYNLLGQEDASTCGGCTPGGLTNGVNGNQIINNSAAGLDVLGNYGGPTQTHRLQTGSPAIDAANNCVFDNSCAPAVGFALTTDQRGQPRKVDGNNDSTATVDIGAYELDSPGSLHFSAANYNDTETNSGTHTATITVQRTGGTGGAVSVHYATSNGSATAEDNDYDAASGDLNWADGDTSDKTFTVTVHGDTKYEPDGTVNLTLSAVVGATIGGTNPATLTIVNDDAAPTISIGNVTVGEAGGNAVFTVTQSAVSEFNTVYVWSTADGTAVAPGDYADGSTIGAIVGGTTTDTFLIAINDDNIRESSETFTVTLSDPVNATIASGQGTGTGTITDNDAAPTFTISDVTQAEGNGGAGSTNFVFTVTKNGNTELASSVQYQTQDGSATAPSDYTAIPLTTLNFAANQATQQVTVVVNGDTVYETNENFFVVLSNPTGRPGGNAPTVSGGIGTITNDDTAPSLTINDVSHSEGNGGTTTYTFTVTKTGSTEVNATVDYATANNTATAPSDYTAITTTPLTFLPADITKTITVNVNGDTTLELDETFFVNLSNPLDATISDNQGVGTIVNDDCDPMPSGMVSWWPGENNTNDILGPNNGIAEGSLAYTAGVVGQAFSFNGTNADMRANASSSLNVGTGSGLTFDTWLNPTSLANPQVIAEWNGGTVNTIGAHIWHSLTNVGVSGPGNVYVNIFDGAGAGTHHVFSTNANALTTGGYQHLAVTYDKATGNASIYRNGTALPVVCSTLGCTPVNSTTVNLGSFTPQTSFNFYLGLRPSTGAGYFSGQMDEVELFNRALSAAEVAGIYNSGVIGKCHTSTLQFSSATYSVNEGGGNAVITVTRTGTHDIPATIDYATVAGGTAIGGASCTGATEYVNTTGTLSFAANQVSKTFNVPVCDDFITDGSKTVNLQLSNVTGSGTSLGSPSAAVLTIADDDCVEPPPANMIAWYPAEGNYNDIQGPTFENGLSAGGPVPFAAGKVGQAFNFGGSSRLNMSTPAALNITGNQVTLDGWINPSVSDLTTRIYFGRSVATGNDYLLLANGGGGLSGAVKTNTGETFVNTFSALPANTWSHIAMTYDGATIKVYLNGAVVASGAKTGNITNSGGPFVIGGRSDGNNFSGLIDEVEVFDRALAGNEILDIYNAGVVGKCKHGLIQFSAPTYTVGEAGVNATITVRRIEGSKGAVTARFDTSNGTAVAGSDYTAVTNFTVSWADGDAADKTVNIPITNDSLYEIGETVNLALTNATGGAQIGSQGTAVLTITDNDTAPTISINSVSVSEGGGNAVFTVTQSAISGANTTFTYSTADGSATAGSDYTGATNVAGGITAGNTTTSISIPITDDGVYEGSEDFTVTLSSPVNATIGTGTGTGTITENDSQPSFSINDVVHNEGDSSTTSYVFTVTKSGSTALGSSVAFQTQNGSATLADSDYQSNSGTLTFTSTDTTMQVTVLVNGDKKVEANEDFTVHLSSPSNATISDADGTGTITNDDHAPVANDVTDSTERNVSKTVTLSATDSDGDALTFSIVTPPVHGALGSISSPVCASGSCTATVTYTPNCNYTGPDPFTYKANDSANDSNTATVSMTVTPHVAPVVINTTDNNTGSLRQALLLAQDGDTITFNIPTSDPGYNSGTGVWTITLTSGQLIVDKDVVISGLGANVLTVTRGTGAGAFRIFLVNSNGGCTVTSPETGPDAPFVTSGIVTIEKMTISNGNGPSGGGIYNDHATLTVDSCTLSGNAASSSSGGGIYNDGLSGTASLTVINCTLSGNSAPDLYGGGIYNGGVSGSGTATIINSTLSANSALYGGAIFNEGISGGSANLKIANSTIIDNSAGCEACGGVYNNAGTLTIGNTIAKRPTNATGRNFTNTGTFTSAGYNLSNDSDAGYLNGFADQVNRDPMLGPLQNNGGPTKTYAPLINSPAIDQGKRDAIPALNTNVDQRGLTRPVNDAGVADAASGDGSDIGAVEIGSFVHPTDAASWKTHFGVGDFPVPLPLPFTSPMGVECRTGATPGDHQIIVTFTNVNTFSGVAVTTGTGSATAALSRPESPESGGTQITINLTGVTNAQAITVALFGVDTGTATADVGIRMGVLLGDTTSTHQVDSSDVSEVQFESGHAVTGLNFRDDVTTNGEINSSDVSTVQFQSGSGF